MSLKLYTYAGNKDAYKALITAEYVGVVLDVPPFRMGKDNKDSDFLEMSPRGQIPVLEHKGTYLYESNAIARFVARLSDAKLFGLSALDAGKVETWIDFSSASLDSPLRSWVMPLLGVLEYDAEKEVAAKAALAESLRVLEAHLTTHTFLVGEGVTLADIITVCNLYLGFKLVFDEDYRRTIPNIARYFSTCVNQPAFAKVLGPVQLCASALTPQ